MIRTDALRVKAAWLSNIDHDFGRGVIDAANELERLRTVIQAAPHWVSADDADECCPWYSDDNYCNCWKKEAL